MAGRQHADVSEAAAELRVVLGQLVRRLREQSSDSELTRTQTAVLGRLDREGGLTTSELARAEGMRTQSMSSIVAALQADGLVTGKPDPSDGRKTLLETTELARTHFRVGRLAREDWLANAMTQSLSPAEIDQVAAGVALLKRLL